jgi:hypothetical protein
MELGVAASDAAKPPVASTRVKIGFALPRTACSTGYAGTLYAIMGRSLLDGTSVRTCEASWRETS